MEGDTIFELMEKNENIVAKHQSPLALAFLGDAVYELLVRELVINSGFMSAHMLHKKSIGFVNALSQAKAVDIILPVLTDEEKVILKRGRNAHGNNVPKNVSDFDYRKATGLEALFGYLYLNRELKRISELFDIICVKSDLIKSLK